MDEAVIQLDAPNNHMCFGAEESLIINISARSLKCLYEQYGYRGLFAQNLRYYVKNARIDGNIIESIQEHPENFGTIIMALYSFAMIIVLTEATS